jgi:hypothetical protein
LDIGQQRSIIFCTSKVNFLYSVTRSVDTWQGLIRKYFFCRYIQETLGLNEMDPMYRQFARIFETFRISEPEKSEDASKGQLQKEPIRELELKKVPKLEDEYEEEEEEEEVKSPLDVT